MPQLKRFPASQAQLDSLKAEAAQAADALRQAKQQVTTAEKDLNASRQTAYEAAQAATQDRQQTHATITNLQVCTEVQQSGCCTLGLQQAVHATVCSCSCMSSLLLTAYKLGLNIT